MSTKHPVIPLVFLGAFSAALVWQTGRDDKTPPAPVKSVVGLTLASASEQPPPSAVRPEAPPRVSLDTPAWAHPEEMHDLRMLGMDDDWHPALERATKVIATDQDVQIEVGNLLISRGNPTDGIAWQLIACADCTQSDERFGYGCAVEGLCDPHLTMVDVFRRDYGDAMVADALNRAEEIKSAIAHGDSLSEFVRLKR